MSTASITLILLPIFFAVFISAKEIYNYLTQKN